MQPPRTAIAFSSESGRPGLCTVTTRRCWRQSFGPRVFDEKCSFRTALLRLFGNAVCRAHLSDLIPKAECEAQVKETACVQLPVVRFFVPQTTSTGILAFFDSDRGKCFSKPRGAEYTVCNLPTDSFDCALRIFIFEQREVRGSSPASLLRFFCFCRSRRPLGCLVSLGNQRSNCTHLPVYGAARFVRLVMLAQWPHPFSRQLPPPWCCRNGSERAEARPIRLIGRHRGAAVSKGLIGNTPGRRVTANRCASASRPPPKIG